MVDLSPSPSRQATGTPAAPPAAPPDGEALAVGARARLGWLALLLVAVGLVLSRGLDGAFVYDDLLMIERNPLITDLANVPAIFGSSYWDFLDPETASRVGYWRPLAGTALTVGYALGDGAPRAFHLLSLAVHMAATAAAFALAARYLRDARAGFFAALLFGLHPVHVESVSWITAVNDPLFGLCALGALWAFVRWRDRGSRGLPLGACALFALALLSKELAVATLPAALALDLGRRRAAGERPLRPFLRPYLALGAVVLLYVGARMLVFGDVRAGFDRTTTHFGVSAARLLVLRFEMLGGFLGLAAFPAEPNLFRPFRPEPASGALLAAGAWIAVFGAAAAGLAVAARRAAGEPGAASRRALGALLLLPACILPALIRVQSIGTFPISDRFLYLAVLGFTLPLAYLVLRALPVLPAVLVLGGVAVAYGTQAWQRQDAWQSEEALFAVSVEQSPDSPNTHWGMGRVLLGRYRTESDPRVLALARAAFERAQDLCAAALAGDGSVFATSDDVLQSNLGLAWTLIYEARTDEFHDYDTPLAILEQLDRNYPENERVLTALGTVLAETGRNAEAEAAFQRALRANDRLAVAHFNLAYLYRRMGDWERALPHFELNVALRPDHVEGLVWLAWGLMETGQPDRARRAAERALAVAPDAANPRLVLGTLAARAGDRTEALRQFEQAARAEPDHAGAHLERAKVLAALGRTQEAVLAAGRAAELAPDNFEASYLTGALLLDLGRPEVALPSLIRAYELRADDETGRTLHERLRLLAESDADLAVRLADVEYRKGRAQGALEWSELALALEPDDAQARFLRGATLARTGRAAEGVADLRAAAQGLPDSHEVHLMLGETLLELGLEAEALEHLERALELPTAVPRDRELDRTLRADLRERAAELRARLEADGSDG